MSEAVTVGLGIISAVLCYSAFQLRDTKDFLLQNLAILLFGFSLFSLQILSAAVVEIADAGSIAGLGGIAEAGFIVLFVVNVLYFFTFFIKAMMAMFRYMWDYTLKIVTGRSKS